MAGLFLRTLAALFGDSRRCSLEHRLFSTISLLNGIANLGGVVALLWLPDHTFLVLLQLGTGLLFLAFYYLSRFRGRFRRLYWPFVLLTLAFVFANALDNGGTAGGAHYYLIPALLIALILSDGRRTTVLAFALFALATGALLLIEQYRPGWVRSAGTREEHRLDVAGNLLFVQAFSGLLVMVLAQNLNQERRKSDRLLLNVLPETVAEELKRDDRVMPRDYESASVLFTDFVGFTKIAEGLTPRELIEQLDGCFRQFDQIARKHGLEKIKTIGDSYMAVGGIPIANRTHAVDCVFAALEIGQWMAELQVRNQVEARPAWQVRIGINTGGLVAGVIGHEKFAYDVWGDTVNTASRLESAGQANRVNISQATYERVKEFFVCEPRGKVATKSKGEMEMYFVQGLRPELCAADGALRPNERFRELYAGLAQAQSANGSMRRSR